MNIINKDFIKDFLDLSQSNIEEKGVFD